MKATGVVLERPTNYQSKVPDYDALWKKVIEDLFEEFMLFFAPDLYNVIDFSKPLEFLKQELHQVMIKEKKGKSIADEIVKVFLKNGEEKWILIHIEVQDKVQEDFGKRMFRYFYRIYDRFDREVYAIALLTDNDATNHTNQFHYSFYGTKVDYTYNVYPFKEENIPELDQSSNPFAAAVIAGIYAKKTKKDVNRRYAFKRKLMIQVLQKFSQHKNARTYLTVLFYFIDYLLQVPDMFSKQLKYDLNPYLGKEVIHQMQAEKTNPSPTLAEIFADLEQEGMEKGLEKGREEGVKEGKKEGKEEGRKDALQRVAWILFHRGYSDEEIVGMTELEWDEVKELRKRFQDGQK